MAGKSQQEKFLEDLQAAGTPEYWQRTEVRRALSAQGINLPAQPRSDAQNPFTGDEAGPASTDSNGITAVNATDATAPLEEDDLDALSRATVELQDATQQRRAADRLKERYPDSDQAQQQSTADKIQEGLGNARRLSNATQSGVRDRVFAAADRLGAVSTPGGIGALVVIVLLLLFILVEVNGQPRGVWTWLVLTRKARLRDKGSVTNNNNVINTDPGQAGVSETAPTHSETGGQPTTGQTFAQVPVGGSNITPINIASALGGLGRYVNP